MCALGVDEAVSTNTGLVYDMARRYKRPGIELEDLVQEGFVGLIEAQRIYDPNKGKFITIAYYHVRDRMQQFLRAHVTPVTIPSEIIRNSKQATRSVLLGRAIYSKAVQTSEDSHAATEKLRYTPPDPVDVIMAHRVSERVNKLPWKKRKVLIEYVINEKTLDAVGQEMQLTRERIRQIFQLTVDDIRKSFRAYA